MPHQPKLSNNLKTVETHKVTGQNGDTDSLNSNTIEPYSPSVEDYIASTNNIINIESTYFEKKYLQGDYTGSTNCVNTFGSNIIGQLGLSAQLIAPYSFLPITINFLNSKNIISISAGDGHSVCVADDGLVYSWGANACGQLGIEEIDSISKDSEGSPFQPEPIPIHLIKTAKIKEIACGDTHTLALSTDGKVFSWGGAGFGQLGQNINEIPKDRDNCRFQPYPKIIETLKSLIVTHIACGKAHSLSIDSNGQLYTWGAGAYGQLGVEDLDKLPVDDEGLPYQPTPKLLKSLKNNNIISGVCGDVHTLILNDKGEVLAFGGGSFGQLGVSIRVKRDFVHWSKPLRPTPTIIDVLSGIFIVSIACGDSHSMAIDKDGRLYAWGAASYGQLGLDFTTNLSNNVEGNSYQSEPRPVSFFEKIKVISVACGENHTLVLCEGGLVYSFGGNNCGQLGFPVLQEQKLSSKITLKSFKNSPNEIAYSKNEKPRLITSLLGKNVLKLATGAVHNIVLFEEEIPFLNSLYSMYKTNYITDYEILLEKNSKKDSSSQQYLIKCHSFVLLSRSHYFYNKIALNKEKSQIVIKQNFSFTFFRTVIEYLYLDDISFINKLESSKDYSINDALLEYLRIARLLGLKDLQLAIEQKLKANLSKYSGLKQSLLNRENKDTEEGSLGGIAKGLFFLPNGNCMLILNEDLIETINKNSLILDLNPGSTISHNQINNSIKENNKILVQNSSQKQSLVNNSNKKKVKFSNSNLKNLTEPEKGEENILNVIDDDDNSISLEKIVPKEKIPYSKFLFDQFTKNEKFDLIDSLTKNVFFDTENHEQIHYDFLKYFNKKETSDVVIKIGEESIYAHKVILASNSKFFETVFSEEMKENTNNEIVISDFSPEEILMFLLYLYSDCLSLDMDRALALLRPADMFSVDLLKTKLENYLASKLEIENAAKIYRFASWYNYDRLKKICLLFINDNYKSVIETSEFEDLHRESILEIIRFCKTI